MSSLTILKEVCFLCSQVIQSCIPVYYKYRKKRSAPTTYSYPFLSTHHNLPTPKGGTIEGQDSDHKDIGAEALIQHLPPLGGFLSPLRCKRAEQGVLTFGPNRFLVGGGVDLKAAWFFQSLPSCGSTQRPSLLTLFFNILLRDPSLPTPKTKDILFKQQGSSQQWAVCTGELGWAGGSGGTHPSAVVFAFQFYLEIKHTAFKFPVP